MFTFLVGMAFVLFPLAAQAITYSSERVLSPSPAFATNGMVASSNPLGSMAGVNIMQQGGNAFDAAVATALALSAVDPAMCGPGGASFWLLWDASKQELTSINADTQAPMAATPEAFASQSELVLGLKAMGIPGNMKAYWEILTKYGTMSFEQVSAPALMYLENGSPITQRQSASWRSLANGALLDNPNFAATFGTDEWPQAGGIVRNPNLAATYRTIAKEGSDAFYKGSIAKEMVDYMQANGGLWTMEDLANYELIYNEPLRMNYKDYVIYGVPPPSAAVTWMEALKIAEGYDWSKIADNSIEYLHLMVEIMRLAHADSYQYVSDPRFVEDLSPLLITDKYAAAQRQRIDLDKAAPGRVQPGDPKAWSQAMPSITDMPQGLTTPYIAYETSVDNQAYRGSTIHVVVADKWGNCVSFTHTLGNFFGAQEALGNTGVVGSNSMSWFDLDINPWTEKPSALQVAPGKRNRFTLSPGMIFKDGKPYIIIGGSGAETTMPGIFQTLMRMLEYNLNPMAALSSPRFIYGDQYHYTAGTRLGIEPELRTFFEEQMKAMGHDVIPGSLAWRQGTGTVMVIQFDHQYGGIVGGAEPRSSGSAAIGF